MTEPSTGIVTYAGLVHPWMCDAMRHLNVRHYVAMFDDASFQLLGRVAGKDPDPDGWADVRMEVDYLRELPAGKLITIRSRVEAVGVSSLRYKHWMHGSIDDQLHATMSVVSVRFDLSERRKRPLTADERAKALSLV